MIIRIISVVLAQIGHIRSEPHFHFWRINSNSLGNLTPSFFELVNPTLIRPVRCSDHQYPNGKGGRRYFGNNSLRERIGARLRFLDLQTVASLWQSQSLVHYLPFVIPPSLQSASLNFTLISISKC